MACRADRPDSEVYDFARLVFEKRESLAQISSVYAGLDAHTALDGLVAPLHPGAERFFTGAGIRPTYAPGITRPRRQDAKP